MEWLYTFWGSGAGSDRASKKTRLRCRNEVVRRQTVSHCLYFRVQWRLWEIWGSWRKGTIRRTPQTSRLEKAWTCVAILLKREDNYTSENKWEQWKVWWDCWLRPKRMKVATSYKTDVPPLPTSFVIHEGDPTTLFSPTSSRRYPGTCKWRIDLAR